MSGLARTEHKTELLPTREMTSPEVREGAVESLMAVVEIAAKQLKANTCSLLLLDSDGLTLIPAATIGSSMQFIGTPETLSGGLSGLVAETGQPVTVEQVRLHPRGKSGGDAFQSFLGVPVIDGGVLQGVLAVQTVEPREFDADETSQLALLARLAAPFASNARAIRYSKSRPSLVDLTETYRWREQNLPAQEVDDPKARD